MLDVLLSGKIFKAPEQRTSANGNKFTIGKIKISDGEDQSFCSFIAFSESAQNALLALQDGDSVCVAGSAKLKVWTNNKGEAKPQLDVTVSNVLTVYSIKKKREKMQGSESEIEPQQHDNVGKSSEYYAPSNENSGGQSKSSESRTDDDIPF